MALTKNYKVDVTFINTGISYEPTIPIDITNTYEIENAYIKIINVSGNKEKMFVQVGIYNADQTTLVKTETYDCVPSVEDDATNFIKQGYVYLKTLDNFSDATDC